MNERQKEYITKTIAAGRRIYLMRNSIMTAFSLLAVGWAVKTVIFHQSMGILDALTYFPLFLVGSLLFYQKQWQGIEKQYDFMQKPRPRGE